MDERPAHHDGGRGFVNPWPTDERTRRDVVRWGLERRHTKLAPDPPAGALPIAKSDVARPTERRGELRITWVGHATFLIQIDGWNVLTDPQWSDRASPVAWAGPRRFVPPGLPFEALPPIHAVIISHDHYDHLDRSTVRRIGKAHPDARWFAPLGHTPWLHARGIRRVASLDWWQHSTVTAGDDVLTVTALPAQHWTSRTPFDRQRRLWASWAIASASGRRVYFAGDSGYFHGYHEIGAHIGAQDAVLMPIGAYDPRWFMAPAHMNPEEAVQAWIDLGGTGTFVGMHWGTWRLTDEDPLEPPRRTADAWSHAGLPADRLWVPQHGETRIITR